MTRWGDYVVMCSAILNFTCVIAYAAQGNWRNAIYFAGASVINLSLVGMR